MAVQGSSAPRTSGPAQPAAQPPPPAWYTANDTSLPAWENQDLNSLYSQGKLYGIPPEILAGIAQAESSGSGGGINSSGYGGFFGLGEYSNYAGGQSTPGLLRDPGAGSFEKQAELAASDFQQLLAGVGGNPYAAEQIYQTGSGGGFGEGDQVLKALGIPTNAKVTGGGGQGSSQLNSVLGTLSGQAGVANELGITGLQQQAGFSQQEYQNLVAQLEQQYGFQQSQFGLTGQQLGISQAQLAQELAQSQTQQGFSQQQYQQQLKQFQNQQAQMELGQKQSLQGLSAAGLTNTGTQRQEIQGYQQQEVGLGIQEAQAHLGYESSQSGYAYSQQQIQNAEKQLQVQFSQLGLNEQEAKASLSNALVNAGLQNVMTGSQLYTQIAQMMAGQPSAVTGVLGQLLSAAPTIGALVGSLTGG